MAEPLCLVFINCHLGVFSGLKQRGIEFLPQRTVVKYEKKTSNKISVSVCFSKSIKFIITVKMQPQTFV